MVTKEQKMQILLNTLGFDEAMRVAPTLTDDADGGSAADKAAAEEAALAKAATTNPFVRGPNFNMRQQARLYANEKTRPLAIRLAKAGASSCRKFRSAAILMRERDHRWHEKVSDHNSRRKKAT
jgi:hypothetical protein